MNEHAQLHELALFAGAGGGILGGHLLGWRTVCAVEYAAHPRSVLLARQRDGFLPSFPVWDDVRTFDGNPWRGSVDVVSGGFPCQDISIAGGGDGLDGERSGLWTEMARIIGQVQPRFVFVENSPMLTSRGLDRVLGDLAALGMHAVWGVVGADDAGAPHQRERIWILAHSERDRAIRSAHAGFTIATEQSGTRMEEGQGGTRPCGVLRSDPIGSLGHADLRGRLHGQAEVQPAEGGEHAQREPQPGGEDVAYAGGVHAQGIFSSCINAEGRSFASERPSGSRDHVLGWWSTEPAVGRVAHGVAGRVAELKALGNGQVPAVVRLAWHALFDRIQRGSMNTNERGE